MTTYVLAETGADNDSKILETDLLCVQAEFLGKYLWNFNRYQDARKEEDHRVYNSGD